MAGKSKLEMFFQGNTGVGRQVTLATVAWQDKFERELFGDAHVDAKNKKLQEFEEEEIG